MINNRLITMNEVNEREYLIKDIEGITIGRVFIIDNDNKNAILKIRWYKKSDNIYGQVDQVLDVLLKNLIYTKDFCKVSIIVDQDLDCSAIIEKGFELEGVLKDSIYLKKNEYKSQFIFGITEQEYKKSHIKNKFCIKGHRIELRILTPSDSEQVLDYCIRNKKHLEYYEPSREERYYTLEVQKSYLIESYKAYLNGREVSFGIFKKGQLIGKLRITNIILGVLKSCNVGYSIDQREQGHGYMKEALNLALEYISDVLDLHRVEASTLLDNDKSQAVLKSCGFKELGINERYIYVNGEWRDHKIFYKVFNWSM